MLFPKSKITKLQLIEYYEKVAPRMIRLIKDRPLTMRRFPNGIHKTGFWQKNTSDFFPSWVKSSRISLKQSGSIDMVLANDLNTLLYITNLGCITPHVWTSRVKKITMPDRMIFDLDPGVKAFKTVIDAAFLLKEILEGEFGLAPYVMTTGSKGLHVVVPIKPVLDFDEVRAFAKDVGAMLCEKNSAKYTISPRKENRRGKLFIDYMRNGYGQMAVAPYALRAIEKGPIATPIDWKELRKSGFSSQHYNLSNISARLKKRCPWEGIERRAKSLSRWIRAA